MGHTKSAKESEGGEGTTREGLETRVEKGEGPPSVKRDTMQKSWPTVEKAGKEKQSSKRKNLMKNKYGGVKGEIKGGETWDKGE